MTVGRSLTSVEVTRMSGITYRMLDYWTRTGLLRPSKHVGGHGDPRRWSDDDLMRARTIKLLLDLGVSLERIRADGDPHVTLLKLHKALSRLVEPERVAV